jgi:hypothetical protein
MERAILIFEIFLRMGNLFTKYKTDPAVLAQLRQRLAEADTAALVAKDPSIYTKEKLIFESFLKGLRALKFEDIIPRSFAGEKHSVIIGNISV